MTSSEGDRVTREEMYPSAGKPTQPLKALIPTFGEIIITGLTEGLESGQLASATLRLTHQGENPQVFEAIIKGKNVTGNNLEIELTGDWQTSIELPKGLPLIADYEGKFYRKIKPEDNLPIAEEGTVLEPNGAYAFAMQGKDRRWFLKLPPADFPRGGKISRFVQPDGIDVIKGESILLYVEPI